MLLLLPLILSWEPVWTGTEPKGVGIMECHQSQKRREWATRTEMLKVFKTNSPHAQL